MFQWAPLLKRSHQQSDNSAKDAAPDDEPAEMFTDHVLDNVFYIFGRQFIEAGINNMLDFFDENAREIIAWVIAGAFFCQLSDDFL